MIAPEVHHREQHVLYSFTQPTLCILMYGRVGIPVIGRIAAQVAELAHGRGADLDPGLGCFHGPVHRPYTTGHVAAAPVCLVLPLAVFAVRGGVVEFHRVFRITDIVEMDAVHVVVRCYFTAEGSQIVGGSRLPGSRYQLSPWRTQSLGWVFSTERFPMRVAADALKQGMATSHACSSIPRLWHSRMAKAKGRIPAHVPGCRSGSHPTALWPKGR